MANPAKDKTQLADASGDGMIADQQALVADPGAITAYTAHASGGVTVTSNAATDLDTTAAALATLEDEVTAMRVTVVAILDILEAHGLMADA